MLGSLPGLGTVSYSNEEMKALCLDLAEKAEPLEAGALRDLAQNYKVAPKQPQKSEFLELSFRQIMLIAALVFLAWTPIAFWLAKGLPEEKQPSGSVVEQLSGFVRTPDGRWTTRTYRFAPREDFSGGIRKFVFTEDATPRVYEGLVPLSKTDYEIQELNEANIWRFVTIKTSDGSDPNKNGRRYYILP